MAFRSRRTWPEPPFEEIRRRARILVIDDQEFPYQQLFERDGYNVNKQDDVVNLSDLEDGSYDLILLDLQGVGRGESNDEGLGVLKHLRAQRPAQIVVAYSEANFGLASQPFFQLADAVLQKSADYIDFKAKVDELLEARFSLGFYIDRIAEETHLGEKDRAKLSQLATQAIVEGKRSNLVSFLRDHSDAATLERVLRIVEVAISVASLWTK
jgi:CheY-like chemotaxis protein